MRDPEVPADLAGLAERIRHGDAAADEELARRFLRRAFTLALVRTRDHEVARDVAQETMLAVLTSVREGRLHDPAALAGYVCGTAKNLVLARLRKDAARGEVPEVESAAPVDIEGDLEQSERQFLVRRVLRALGAPDRLVLLLTFVEGLSPDEAGEKLGIRPDAVRQRKVRALRRARALLDRLSRPSAGRHLLTRES
jgi:RNA polymerase sigma factor (sigma-70 family)